MSAPLMQRGFSLVTAIFLLAVLAVLMVNIVDLGIGQQATVVMAIQGARALQAARSGIEVGISQALNSGTCPAPGSPQTLTFPSGDTVFKDFSVEIICETSAHTEGISTVTVYQITATAEFRNYAIGVNANPDYVSRRLRVTVSNNPP